MTTPLICFPFAGAGASFFRTWRARLSDRFELIPVVLPGREQRAMEEPLTDVARAIDDVLPELGRKLAGREAPLVFGHSLGAVLAYELARRLAAESPGAVRHLVVSGSPGPTRPRQARATGLTDEEFMAEVRKFAGYSHPALDDPEMRELLLPLLRADVEMHEAYAPPSVTPMALPITAVRGRADDLVSADDAATWQEATTLPIARADVDGGHMYLVDAPEALFRVLEGAAS
jgi:surfactin synthase thioesterase subunit